MIIREPKHMDFQENPVCFDTRISKTKKLTPIAIAKPLFNTILDSIYSL